ncbi:AI-2E family transporter [uncultured Aureimonas sp.]|uniref:AI-2E family transporter n=1 Tax=uncultured Aureimonas sp. TaxID=1604662 RepID=UPI0025E157C6|nr:AI-2E family transporter [uncultured Aureimonas sp.]
MSRRAVAVAVLAVAFLIVLWTAPDVLLVVFAGILMAVFLRGGGEWIARKLNIRGGYGLAIFAVALAVGTLLFFGLAGAALAAQVQEFWDKLPGAVSTARGYVDGHPWVAKTIDSLDPSSLAPSGESATAAFSSTLGAFGNVVVIVFIGLYGAVSPRTYVGGTTALVAPSQRPKFRSMIDEAGVALRGWLRAQFVSMSVVGVLTGLGLWALGVPLAPLLAVLAALLTFIPNIGPVLAALPAVLLGLSSGPGTALWVIGLYVAVQTIESYLITPQVQQESVSLPPALTISVQLLFGVLFGILGLGLATPLAAVALRLGRMFYVKEYLDGEAEVSKTVG